METRVLIAYASKHGMTAEIAAKIGKTLQQSGLQVDVLPVQNVKNLVSYQAVVLGSAVYIAMWRKELVKFLRENEGQLSGLPLWVFSSGPMGEGDPVELLQGWRFPEAQRPLLERIKPCDIAVFHGAIDLKNMNFLEKWTLKNVKAPTGDYRDWDMITRWAGDIARAVKR